MLKWIKPFQEHSTKVNKIKMVMLRMSKVNKTLSIEDGLHSSVAAGMWTRTLQFSLMLADHSRPAMLPRTLYKTVVRLHYFGHRVFSWSDNQCVLVLSAVVVGC